MRPADLPSARKLGAKRPHGHYMRCLGGCRCRLCRAALADYYRTQAENLKLYGPNDLVSTDRVRKHLKYLSQHGMGHKTVAKHSGVGKTSLAEIVWYGKKMMRRRAETRVLAVQPTLDTMPCNHDIPVSEAAKTIRQLVEWGYPKTLVSRDALGNSGPLQIAALKGKTAFIEVETARRVRDFFERVQRARKLWMEIKGPIPSRHYVYWRGSRLELRAISVNHDWLHRYPAELKKASIAMNKLKRQIKEQTKWQRTH